MNTRNMCLLYVGQRTDGHFHLLYASGRSDNIDKSGGMSATYVIKPDLDGLLGSIKQFVSRAESAVLQLLPAEPKVNISLPLTYEIDHPQEQW